jgi:hypothetical protein
MTTNQPPRRAKVLTRLKITEVSAVDRGAGENCKIVLSKRDDGPDDNTRREMPEHERRYWEALGATALRHAEERFLKEEGTGYADHTPEDDPSRFYFSKETFLRKSYAARAAGDEAAREDEATPVDEMADDDAPPPPDGASAGVPKKHLPISFDIVDGTRLEFPNERALAVWLAAQERIRKSNQKESIAMTQTTLEAERTEKLREVVKAYGIMPLAKQMIAEGSSYGIDESEFTKLATAHAQGLHPDMSPAAAFEKLFSDNSEDGVILREAHSIAKAATFTPIVVDGNADNPDDAREAYEALMRLAEEQRARAPWMSAEQAFDEVMRKNLELAAKALRRPAPTTLYPFPR